MKYSVIQGQCAGSHLCPLSRVQAGAVVCIKKVAATPAVTARLREMGLCEEQQVKLLSRKSNADGSAGYDVSLSISPGRVSVDGRF